MQYSSDTSLKVDQVAAQWLRLYVATARSRKNAMMAAQRVNDFVRPFMGHLPIAGLHPNDLREYRLNLEAQGYAPRTVRHLLADLRCMLTWAEDSGIIDRSPFPRRLMPRIQEAPPDRLTDGEVVAVLTIPEPQAFVVRLALETGLRWAELCRAEPSHVRVGMLLVSQTKSGKVRRVPLNLQMQRDIAKCAGRLVPYGVGSAGSFGKVVRRHSGVARFHVHQLRHTFACRWIERGGSLAALQQILGHASVTTTQVYAKLSDDSVRREAERIAGNAAAC